MLVSDRRCLPSEGELVLRVTLCMAVHSHKSQHQELLYPVQRCAHLRQRATLPQSPCKWLWTHARCSRCLPQRLHRRCPHLLHGYCPSCALLCHPLAWLQMRFRSRDVLGAGTLVHWRCNCPSEILVLPCRWLRLISKAASSAAAAGRCSCCTSRCAALHMTATPCLLQLFAAHGSALT